jgi:hypothetical protein
MSKITKSARMEECTVRIPEKCNFNPETTVFAHLPGGGMGMKKSDLHGAYCCSSCHDIIDSRVPSDYPQTIIELWHRHGIERTQDILLEKGLIVIT